MVYEENPPGCISVNKFISFCISRYLPIVDDDKSVLKMLGISESRQVESLKSIVVNALREYERYCPLLMIVNGGTSVKDYVDNFDSYLAGDITEDEIQLVPITIVRVSSMFGKITSAYWQYNRPNMQSRYFHGSVKAYCKYPYRFKISEDGYLSEDSIIYGLFKGHSRPDIFQTFFDYEFIGTLDRNSKLLQLPSELPSMNYEGLLESIGELRSEMIRDALNIILTTGNELL